MESSFDCAACGEPVFLSFELHEAIEDPRRQTVYDCPVCCRPNVLWIDLDAESGDVSIRNELE